MQASDTGNLSRRPEKAAPPRVLVVEDDPLMRWAVTQTLRDHACDVVEGRDAEDARRAVRRSTPPFDVIVLEHRLPGSDDFSLLRSLHALSPRTRIVLMTAFGSLELIAAGALTLGAAAVMAKPFDMSDLSDLVAFEARA